MFFFYLDEFWIQTIQAVEKGEELTINYVGLHLPQKERNQKLELQYEFTCECDKCLQIDKNSTLNRIDEYLEAFKCTKESCNGVFLLQSKDENKILECQNCKFQSSDLVSEYEDILQDIKSKLLNIQEEQGSTQASVMPSLKERIISLEQLTDKYLHPYNSYVFQLKMAKANFFKYCAALEFNVNGFPDSSLEARKQNLEELVNVLKQVNKFCLLIYPKFHPQRAHILLDLGNVSSVLDRPGEGKKFITQGIEILNISRGSAIAKDQLRQLFTTGH